MSEFLTKQFAFCVSPSLEKPFPYAYAMVVYNGKEPYNYSTYLKDMIQGPAACLDNLFGKGFDLLDLYRTDDKQFMQFLRSGLMCRFMKHIHDILSAVIKCDF